MRIHKTTQIQNGQKYSGFTEIAQQVEMDGKSDERLKQLANGLNRFCVLRGYLKKGTDLLDGVPKYPARKFGAIEIYTPDEMKLLLGGADKRLVPFLSIAAFAGLRSAERRAGR